MTLCNKCNGACCRYIIFDLSNAKNPDEMWVLALRGFHPGTLNTVKSVCSKLDSEGKCSIYAERPMLCRMFKLCSRECVLCRKAEGFL